MKFCPKCNNETERNSRGECKPCALARVRAWQAANPERVRARKAAWAAANLEKARAQQAAWRAANPERLRAYAAEYRASNADKLRATSAAYYAANAEKAKAYGAARYAANTDKIKADTAKWAAANPEKANASKAKWAAKNPEACRTYVQNRRARKREAGGKLSKDITERLFKLQRGKCACGCKQPLGEKYHLDHIMPLALGGTNTDDNIQLLRAACNHKKHAKHPIEFMQQRGFLL